MEYLMTYGWSILIICIVVAVLYVLGAFGGNAGSVGSGSCVAVSGFQCTSPSLNAGGYLSVIFGQIGQRYITVTATACTTGNAAPSGTNSITSVTLNSGAVQIISFSCPTSGKVGQTFTGYLWIIYSTSTQTNLVQQVAKVRVPITSGATTPVPGEIAYVPFNIINSQSSAIGSNFQQMITFNPIATSAFTTNEASDLGNIRFYQGITELYSWCESGCNSILSSSAVFWVLLPGGLGSTSPSNSVMVNMYFMPTSTEYDGVYTGECPTCSGSYAQYDNGASIFTNYQNFKSTPSGWVISGSTISSGATINPGGQAYTSTDWYIANTIVDAYDKWTSLSDDHGSFMGASPDAEPQAWTDEAGSSWAVPYDRDCTGSGSQRHNLNTFGVEGIYQSSNGHYGAMFNYANGGVFGGCSEVNAPFYAVMQSDSVFIQWVRERVYPPGGVMPTVTPGAMSN
jgi:hypothetical protein